jgi:hypothetical protein
MEFPLLSPIQFGKITINKLDIRDYSTAEDYLSFDQRGGVAQNHALISSMSGQDVAVIKNLRGPDYLRAVKVCNDIIDSDAVVAFPKTSDQEQGDQKGAAEKKLPAC